MSRPSLKHLLMPKEFRVWCIPNRPISAALDFTTKPSEANCANCLTAFRAKTTGKIQPFKVAHTTGRKERDDYPDWRTPVLPENL